MCGCRLLCPGGVLVWSLSALPFALQCLFVWFRRGLLSLLCFASRTVRVCVAFLLRVCVAFLLELTNRSRCRVSVVARHAVAVVAGLDTHTLLACLPGSPSCLLLLSSLDLDLATDRWSRVHEWDPESSGQNQHLASIPNCVMATAQLSTGG